MDISVGYTQIINQQDVGYELTITTDGDVAVSQTLGTYDDIPFHCTVNKAKYGGITCTLFTKTGTTTSGLIDGSQADVWLDVGEQEPDSSNYICVLLNGAVSSYAFGELYTS